MSPELTRHKDGAVLCVTNVPARAAPFVAAGDKATVQHIEHPESLAYAIDTGLYMVQIGQFTFWWSHRDLGLVQ